MRAGALPVPEQTCLLLSSTNMETLRQALQRPRSKNTASPRGADTLPSQTLCPTRHWAQPDTVLSQTLGSVRHCAQSNTVPGQTLGSIRHLQQPQFRGLVPLSTFLLLAPRWMSLGSASRAEVGPFGRPAAQKFTMSATTLAQPPTLVFPFQFSHLIPDRHLEVDILCCHGVCALSAQSKCLTIANQFACTLGYFDQQPIPSHYTHQSTNQSVDTDELPATFVTRLKHRNCFLKSTTVLQSPISPKSPFL